MSQRLGFARSWTNPLTVARTEGLARKGFGKACRKEASGDTRDAATITCNIRVLVCCNIGMLV